MQINRAASMQLESIAGDAPIAQAAAQMKTSGVGLLLVANGANLIGVVTDRDIVTRAAAVGMSLDHAPIRDIMSAPVVCIDGDLDISEAARMVSLKKVRRLVVTNDFHRPVGVLSLDDIAFSTHGDETAAGILEEIAHGPEGAALFRGA